MRWEAITVGHCSISYALIISKITGAMRQLDSANNPTVMDEA